ncbi:MAG: hypothetical protein ACUVWX_08955 [Kiritimatiellia bacterium]
MEGTRKLSPLTSGGQRQSKAILLELENIAARGHEAMFNALKTVLGNRGINLEPTAFSKWCLDSAPSVFLPRLLEALDKKRSALPGIQSEFSQLLHGSVVEGGPSPASALTRLLSLVRDDAKIRLGLLTMLEQKTVLFLTEKLGLSPASVAIEFFSGQVCCPTSRNPWLRLADKLQVAPQDCVALVTSAASCRVALVAGMWCVVVTDSFTEHQDFAGADYVTNCLDENAIATIASLLRIRK